MSSGSPDDMLDAFKMMVESTKQRKAENDARLQQLSVYSATMQARAHAHTVAQPAALEHTLPFWSQLSTLLDIAVEAQPERAAEWEEIRKHTDNKIFEHVRQRMLEAGGAEPDPQARVQSVYGRALQHPSHVHSLGIASGGGGVGRGGAGGNTSMLQQMREMWEKLKP